MVEPQPPGRFLDRVVEGGGPASEDGREELDRTDGGIGLRGVQGAHEGREAGCGGDGDEGERHCSLMECMNGCSSYGGRSCLYRCKACTELRPRGDGSWSGIGCVTWLLPGNIGCISVCLHAYGRTWVQHSSGRPGHKDR